MRGLNPGPSALTVSPRGPVRITVPLRPKDTETDLMVLPRPQRQSVILPTLRDWSLGTSPGIRDKPGRGAGNRWIRGGIETN